MIDLAEGLDRESGAALLVSELLGHLTWTQLGFSAAPLVKRGALGLRGLELTRMRTLEQRLRVLGQVAASGQGVGRAAGGGDFSGLGERAVFLLLSGGRLIMGGATFTAASCIITLLTQMVA